MGRTVKRVALDFNWPLEKPYEGFLNPHYTAVKCECCDGSGYSPRAKHLYDSWYGYVPFDPEADKDSPSFLSTDPVIWERAKRNVEGSPNYYGRDAGALGREAERLAELFNARWSHHLDADDVQALIDDGRLHSFTHIWADGRWNPAPYITPTPRMINEWSLSGMGHDSINCWVVVRAACQRENVESGCEHCDGQGVIWPSEEDEQRYEDWKPTEPPEGPGYQVWETVSEGSPISPVFASAFELAEYMSHTRYGADRGTSREQWFEFIVGPGWAPSLVIQNGKILNDIHGAIDD